MGCYIITTYLSASSIKTSEMCEQKFFIESVLRKRGEPHYKAVKGTIVHKVMEILAQESIAKRAGRETFVDEDFGEYTVGKCDLDRILQKSFDTYKDQNTTHEWDESDLIDCRNWSLKCLKANEGIYHPHNLEILAIEKAFDITLPHEWAKLDFTLPNGKKVSGQLGIKGFMDLVIQQENGAIEVVDWKTGGREDLTDLENNIQLLIYYYVAKLLYPDASCYYSTLVAINSGGVASVFWEDEDLKRVEDKIQGHFERIKKVTVPKLLWREDPSQSFFCNKICSWGQRPPGGRSFCYNLHEEIVQIGISNVMKKHMSEADFERYAK